MGLPKLAGVSFTALPQSYTKIFDGPGVNPIIEHFQASRRQFKWRRAIRKTWQTAILIGVPLVLALAYWLSKHLVWKA
jgi:H+/Cl- antiporter ClcA